MATTLSLRKKALLKTFPEMIFVLFLSNCLDIVDKINRKKYKRNDLVKLIDDYNMNCK